MPPSSSKNALAPLVALGTGMVVILVAICLLSRSFDYEVPQQDRPLLLVLSLFGTCCIGYLLALWVAVKTPNSTQQNIVVLGFALLFRIALVASEPIQEIDIYRYVWDGVAVSQGVNPFQYTPAQALAADGTSGMSLDRLAAARDASPAVETLLNRVHFGHLPTVYPPVSQAVFAVAAWTTPLEATAATRVLIMKAWLLLFDIATIGIVFLMLRRVGLHEGWTIAYAWCPLVLKEVANSGHLDTIAVCFSALSVMLAMGAVPSSPGNPPAFPTSRIVFSVFALAMGVGAKLYPVVLAPLLFATFWRQLGLLRTSGLAVLWSALTLTLLLPLWFETAPTPAPDDPESPFVVVVESAQFADAPATRPPEKTAGLKTFLSQWMMNDLLFLNLIENLTPDHLRNGPTPWFVFVDDDARAKLLRMTSGWIARVTEREISEQQLPFAIARCATAILFLALALFWAWKAARCTDARQWGEYVFLTMAWFWLLLPTLNPWYWVWALPWIPFAKNRVWLLLSASLFLYYTRFYFVGRFPDESVWPGLPYQGAEFFDYVVVWFEYLPWFGLLIINALRGRVSGAVGNAT